MPPLAGTSACLNTQARRLLNVLMHCCLAATLHWPQLRADQLHTACIDDKCIRKHVKLGRCVFHEATAHV